MRFERQENLCLSAEIKKFEKNSHKIHEFFQLRRYMPELVSIILNFCVKRPYTPLGETPWYDVSTTNPPESIGELVQGRKLRP